LLLASTLPAACRTIDTPRRLAADPVVVLHGAEQEELGVATDYGVVFLGRGARSGRIEFTVWFGDGPSREEGVVEAVGGGLFATEAEIDLPTVPITFAEPAAGEVVLVRGRRGLEGWEVAGIVARDPRVSGLLLEPNPILDALGEDQTGAGVFRVREGKPAQLLGLVSGRIELTNESGTRRYITAVGARDLWRLVVYRRNSDRPQRRVYREDIR
jgi:hypothetical protein